MRIATPTALLLPVLCLAACASIDQTLVQTPPVASIAELGRQRIGDSVDAGLLATLTLDYVNLYRARYARPRLNTERNAELCAQWMAVYQSTRARVTHVATDVPAMRVFPQRYREYGGESYARGGENAGWFRLIPEDSANASTYDQMARRIVDGWINSPDHRRILLSSQGELEGRVGIGIARGLYDGFDGIYSTMNVFFSWPDQTEADLQASRSTG